MIGTVGCGDSNTTPRFANIAFLSNRPANQPAQLFVAKLDGTSVTLVPNAPSGYSPSISADFTRVAYEFSSNIFVENVDGTGQAQLTTSNNSYFARISPNGRKIVYSEYSGSPASYHFWISNIDGTGKLDLTPATLVSVGQCFTGSFSADSSQVVFICYNAGSFSMYITKADGTGVKTVIQPSNLFLDSPSFTPDSKKIVLYANGPVTLTAQRSGGTLLFTPGVRHEFKVRQKGSSIPTYGVTSINVDGTGPVLLVPGSYESVILNSTLYYTLHSSTLNHNQIYKAKVDGTNPVSISDGTSNDYLGQSQN